MCFADYNYDMNEWPENHVRNIPLSGEVLKTERRFQFTAGFEKKQLTIENVSPSGFKFRENIDSLNIPHMDDWLSSGISRFYSFF